jgi:hypothetical protein
VDSTSPRSPSTTHASPVKWPITQAGSRGSVASMTVTGTAGGGIATPVRATPENRWPGMAAATAARAALTESGPSRCWRSSPAHSGATATTAPPSRVRARSGSLGCASSATTTWPGTSRSVGRR